MRNLEKYGKVRVSEKCGKIWSLEKCGVWRSVTTYPVGIYQRTHKELTMQLNFTTNPQRTHQIPTGYILITWWVLFKQTLDKLTTVPNPSIGRYLGGYFLKILNMCPVGIWVSELWVKYKINQNGPSGSMLGILFQNPPCTHHIPSG